MLKKAKVRFLAVSAMAMTMIATAVGAESVSLITPEVTTIISSFADNIVPTVLSIISIVVPVALTCWAIGFGIKKGISFLQRRASKAL